MIAERRANFWLPGILTIACAGLGWAAYSNLTTPISPADAALPDRGAALPLQPLPAAPNFEMPDRETFEEVLLRPLFAPSRRPDAAAVPAAAAPAAFDLLLRGVIMGVDDSIALLASAKDQSLLRLALGQNYKDWTLTTVEADNVIFRRGNEQVRLDILFDLSPVKPGANPAANPNPRNAVTPRAVPPPTPPTPSSVPVRPARQAEAIPPRPVRAPGPPPRGSITVPPALAAPQGVIEEFSGAGSESEETPAR